jgi:hypothetical protein
VSILTSSPLQVWPSASNSITVESGSTPDAFGDWVEIIPANAIAAPIYIAGVCAELFVSGLTNGSTTIIEFGTGDDGNEIAISQPIIVVASAGNLALEVQMFLVPIGNISSGARLSMRSAGAANIPAKFALMYYQGLDPEFAMLAPYAYAPLTATGTAITPNASAWADSGWAEVVSLGADSALLGIGARFAGGYAGIEYEIDLGAGLPGDVTLLTTLRGTFSNAGSQGYMDLWLPAMYPIDEDTTISFRMRKAGTSTTILNVFLIYIHEIPHSEVVVTSLEMMCDVGQFIINGSGFTDTMTIAVQGPTGVLAFTVVSIGPTQVVLAIDDLVTGSYCVDLTP